MARHPFSRRSRRRKRTIRAALRGLRFSADPFAEFGDGWISIKPRFQKVIGKRVLRWSSGRRLGKLKLLDPQGVARAHHSVRVKEEETLAKDFERRLGLKP